MGRGRMKKVDRPLPDGRVAIYRHPLLVRLSHAVNAVCLLALLLSGLQILNAHPALYWGEASRFDRPFAAITQTKDAAGDLHGRLQVGGLEFDTTGLLGASRDASGALQPVAFPGWLTLPSQHDLGAGRQWHFFMAWLLVANGAIYGLPGLAGGRFRRVLLPRIAELKGIGRAIGDHMRLRFAHGEDARAYNVLQKLAYVAVIFGLLPLMVITGLAMSPAMDARLPFLSEVLGGRQTARSLHFLTALSLVAFFVLHMVMVLAAGPLNELRSILTGWFVIGGKDRR